MIISNITFKSNKYREIEMARLRELQKQRELEKAIEQERQADIVALLARINSYPDLENPLSTKVAGFLSQFTCAIQNSSEHNVMEFFGDEETAKNLRRTLSPECQADSIGLRNEVQNLEEVKDPVMALICANRMQKFAPKEGVLTKDQHSTFVEGIKSIISTVVRGADFSKFEDEDKFAMLKMVQKIEDSDSVKFGIEKELKALVDKLNSKKLDLGFIPPVQVKNLDLNRVVTRLKK